MTLFQRLPETPDSVNEDRTNKHPDVEQVLELLGLGTLDLVVEGRAAPNVHELPVGAKAKKIGTFADAEGIYFGDEPTYYMDGSF